MIKKSFIFLGVIIMLNGCIDYKSYLKTDIDMNFSVNLPVDISTPGMKSGLYAFDETKTFSLIGEPSLAEYLENVQAVTLTGLSATVTELEQNVVLTDALLSITDGTDSVSWNFDEISVSEGSILELTNNNDEFATLSTMLGTLGNVDVRFTGYSDTNDIHYVLRVDLETKITVGL